MHAFAAGVFSITALSLSMPISFIPLDKNDKHISLCLNAIPFICRIM